MWFWKEVWRKANTRAKRAGCRGVPRFAKGVYQGVLSQARLIRETLRGCSHPSHVYEGQFCFEMERSLRAVEKFKDLGVDEAVPVNAWPGWDGNFREEPMNPGVFVYYLEVELVGGEVRVVSGDLTVVR